MRAPCIVALVAAPLIAEAGEIDPASIQLWDVVHVADGSVLKGVIVEEVPNTSIRIVLAGGSSIVVQAANIVRYGRELNPAFAAGATAAAVGGPARPARTATSGLRFGVMPGIAKHIDGDATFLATTHLGWEIGLDQWGLTPSAVIHVPVEAGPYGDPALAVLGSLRAAYRGSSLSPFIGFGIGPDLVDGDLSLGTSMNAGIQLVVHRRIALTIEAMFHRSWADEYSDKLYFAALGMGLEVRL